MSAVSAQLGFVVADDPLDVASIGRALLDAGRFYCQWEWRP